MPTRKDENEAYRAEFGWRAWKDITILRGELKTLGVDPKEAKLKAVEIFRKFKNVTPVDEESDIYFDPEYFSDRESVSLNISTKWVLANLFSKEPSKEACPSAEAWGMLQMSRQNGSFKAKLYEYVPKLFERTKDSTDKIMDDGREELALIKQIESDMVSMGLNKDSE